MNWIQERPNLNGWYWMYRTGSGIPPSVVLIDIRDPGWVHYSGSDESSGLSEMSDSTWWWGPITHPAIPAKKDGE